MKEKVYKSAKTLAIANNWSRVLNTWQWLPHSSSKYWLRICWVLSPGGKKSHLGQYSWPQGQISIYGQANLWLEYAMFCGMWLGKHRTIPWVGKSGKTSWRWCLSWVLRVTEGLARLSSRVKSCKLKGWGRDRMGVWD